MTAAKADTSSCRFPRWLPGVTARRSWCRVGPYLAAPTGGESAVSIERIVIAFAGSMVLLSLVLGELVSPYFLLLNAFVGLNLLQSSFTGFCPLAIALKWFGLRAGTAY
jgi:hypothetical protein